MSENDIIFTAYNKERKVEYILYRGSPASYGFEHIKHRRPYIGDNIHIVEKGVASQDVAYLDSEHGTGRERVYCLGADLTKPKMYIAVVVDYIDCSTGKIITAWLTRDLQGDEMTYVKSKR
jgi:hypothetical protein